MHCVETFPTTSIVGHIFKIILILAKLHKISKTVMKEILRQIFRKMQIFLPSGIIAYFYCKFLLRDAWMVYVPSMEVKLYV